MPIDVFWYNNAKTIIVLDFKHPHITTWNEYHDAVEIAYEMIRTVDHEVIAIFLAKDTRMPPGAPLIHMRQAINNAPENMICAITAIDQNVFERLMLNIIQKIARYKIPTYTVTEPEEAFLMAQEMLVATTD